MPIRSSSRRRDMPGSWSDDPNVSHFQEVFESRMAPIRNSFNAFLENPLGEIAGSFGDFGTTAPLMIAMASQGQISLTSTLVCTGFANILVGGWFGLPIPIQPMKAIASVAMARNLSQGEVMAAGLSTAAIIGFLAVTGLLNKFNSLIPVPIIKGIQLGAGLSLIISSASQLHLLSWLTPNPFDNLIWFVGLLFLLFSTFKWKRFPLALIILSLGMFFALMRYPMPDRIRTHLHFYLPRFSEWKSGFFEAGIGQIPLTVLNSIIATHHLSHELLPTVPRAGITELGVSIAVLNVGSFFGAMPICHGSGGLAAQYRFGARSGASMVFLGMVKIALGFFAGDSLVEVLRRFPISYLAIMVFAAGVELCNAGEGLNHNAPDLGKLSIVSEEKRRDRWIVMIVTAGGMIAFKNVAWGFMAGLVCSTAFTLEPKMAALYDSIVRRMQTAEHRPLLS